MVYVVLCVMTMGGVSKEHQGRSRGNLVTQTDMAVFPVLFFYNPFRICHLYINHPEPLETGVLFISSCFHLSIQE